MAQSKITITELKRKNPNYFSNSKNTVRLFRDGKPKIKTREKTGDKYLIEAKVVNAKSKFFNIPIKSEVFEIRKIDKNLKLGRAKKFSSLEGMEYFLEME